MATIFVGIGSNLGDRRKNIKKAISFLREVEGISVERVSHLVRSYPVGGGGPDYLNGVLKLASCLSPQVLLLEFKKIEKKIGRVSSFKNAPRIIDLDLLLYDDVRINENNLTVPHPKMFERQFVMNPLLKIAPELKGKINSHKNLEKII